MADKWKKGSCSECGRINVWVKVWAEEETCFECVLTKLRVAIQLAIKESGLKAAQIEWENMKPQMKRDIEEGKKRDPQVEEIGKKFIETIENDIYPNKKRNHYWLIGGIIVGVLILVGIIYWWWKNKEKD